MSTSPDEVLRIQELEEDEENEMHFTKRCVCDELFEITPSDLGQRLENFRCFLCGWNIRVIYQNNDVGCALFFLNDFEGAIREYTKALESGEGDDEEVDLEFNIYEAFQKMIDLGYVEYESANARFKALFPEPENHLTKPTVKVDPIAPPTIVKEGVEIPVTPSPELCEISKACSDLTESLEKEVKAELSIAHASSHEVVVVETKPRIRESKPEVSGKESKKRKTIKKVEGKSVHVPAIKEKEKLVDGLNRSQREYLQARRKTIKDLPKIHRKLKKTLRQIDEIKTKAKSSLNDDQKRKIQRYDAIENQLKKFEELFKGMF